ncbi:hypothetical protein [Umezawaea sp. NPDC059074]|uniref:hypothetical protein n=1 Tax=Umezawaea sp. NPDC059074 TaxID=3346716 RepID=UPI0036BCD713
MRPLRSGLVMAACLVGSVSGLDFVHGQDGLCLDGSVSGGVRLKACNGSSYQEWID